MPLSLSLQDLSRYEAVSRAMVSPLAAPDVDAWRAEVATAMRELLQADTTLFMLSTADAVHFSPDLDASTVARYDRYVDEAGPHGVSLHDPVITRWLELQHRRPQEALNNAVVNHALAPHGFRIQDSPLVQESMAATAMRDQQTLFVTFTGGQAMIQCGFREPSRGRFGEEGLDLLRSLVPSFRAGLETLTRLGAQREALDAVGEPLAVFRADGAELHRTPALARALAHDPQAAFVERALARAGAAAVALRPIPPGVAASESVRTTRGTYTFRAASLPAGLFGQDRAGMVTVEPPAAAALPGEDLLRERLRLTRREAEVALLVAEGLSNREVADRLYVSPHTARHHVENVLAKLDVSSRAAVAGRLVAAA